MANSDNRKPARRINTKRKRKALTQKNVLFVGGVLAALATIIVLVSGIHTWIRTRGEEKADRLRCQELKELAEEDLNNDDFDLSLKTLNSEEVTRRCSMNKDIDVLRLTVQTFKLASEVDQFKLVTEKNVISEIEYNIRLIKTAEDRKSIARLYVLEGILQDLRDSPSEAVKKYEKAIEADATYPNAYNSWGYTILKWQIGGADWPSNALAKFDKSAELAAAKKRNYLWPHLNKAVVFLRLAQSEIEKEGPDFREIEALLGNAKEALANSEIALKNEEVRLGKEEYSLRDQPRVHLLWGHYHFIHGQLLNAEGQPRQDINRSFDEALRQLQDAKRVNPKIADIPNLLSQVYWLYGDSQNPPDEMQERALSELRNSVSLDGTNLEACIDLALLLASRPDVNAREEAVKQIATALQLLESFRNDFGNRLKETSDENAKRWLNNQLKMIAVWENELGELRQQLHKGVRRQSRKIH